MSNSSHLLFLPWKPSVAKWESLFLLLFLSQPPKAVSFSGVYTVPCLESEFSAISSMKLSNVFSPLHIIRPYYYIFITPRHLLETISGLAFFCYWITVGKYKCSHVLITLPEANVRYPKNEYKGNFDVVRNKITVQLIGTTVNKMVNQLYEFIFQKYVSGLALKDQPTHSHTYRMHGIHVYLYTDNVFFSLFLSFLLWIKCIRF